jgi:tetratricopeptide (TPR) repeat protein
MRFKSSTCVSALCAAAIAVVLGGGCTEVRGRKKIQEANELYREGKYADAVARFEEAEALVPELPTLWLNKGYTCRQLIAPGGKDPESQKAAACALAAFKRLAEVAPKDPRADQLTIQTWFDTDDFTSLERTFRARHERAPDDLEPVRGLQEVYFKSGKWPEALEWSKRAAALRARDAEAQYGVGTFSWQILSSRGGGTEMASYDPWPRARCALAEPGSARRSPPREGMGTLSGVPCENDGGAAVVAAPPAQAINDVTGALRVTLADQGIAYLEKALALRPQYPEAMTYLSLLWRQKSFAFFDDPIAWQGAVDQSDEWQRRAFAARGGKT